MMINTDLGWNMGFGAGLLGWVLMIIFWSVIVWLIFWLIKQNMHDTSSNFSKTPRAILRSRYAKGEITTKEYTERRKELDADSIF